MIPITELEEETLIEFNRLKASILHLDVKNVKQFHNINANVKLHKTATGIAADFEVTFIADMTCVRCLEGFSSEFRVSTHLDYIEGKDPLAKVEKIELHRIHIDMVYYKGRRVDVSVGIREAIIFALPIASLCRQNCLGLCLVCGGNLNKKKCGCKIEKVGLFTTKNTKVKKN